MLSDVMEHFGLRKSLHQGDFFETEHHRQLLKDLKAAIHEGGIVALTGVVGSGKTLLLWRIQDQLRHEGQIEVAESLVFDVPRVTLSTLKLALYYDLATDKDGDLPGRLLLDSRVVDLPMASNPTLVMFSSLKPLFFNSLKNELHFSDNAGA